MSDPAQLARLDALATDVGRLRRRHASNPGWSGTLFLDEIARHVEVLHGMATPTAAEVYADCLCACADEQLSLAEALAYADGRVRTLRRQLGEIER
jgi:hypothetical protein